MFVTVVDISKAAFKTNPCISALFKLYLVMTSRMFVSYTNKRKKWILLSIWGICLLILQKHFWEGGTSLRGMRGPRKPGPGWGCSLPPLWCLTRPAACTRPYHDGYSCCPLDLVSSRFTRPWMIQHLTHYLGLHACFIKPMTSIQLEI